MTLERILIANRGEIACRIIRAVQALGRTAIAVYSEADADAPHVRLADVALPIGPPPAADSYLNVEAILHAAQRSQADAVHPGYGFLAENAAFARACGEAELVFIGPPPDAIEIMGNKAAAKRRMQAAGVPCVPGYEGEDQSDGTLETAAAAIGYPLMVKAAAGGGGRGMRRVEHADDLVPALTLARGEALSAFGSDELILEKAIVRPRHVEIQVFADGEGNVIHLGERDCSVQRRHQKVVEEAPCPVMTGSLREAMGTAAVEAARSIAYLGAGTVEFLLDQAGRFYFLEMNTRLQVEHPVTELVTGVDLVALQIHVAEGAPLGIAQRDIRLHGHAIEARLYAEDPRHDFMPSTGGIVLWRPPSGEGIRVDAGVVTGTEIPAHYDAMVAKVIAWGETRESARRRLVAALERSALFGVENNRDFLIRVLGHETFAAGEATTAFISEATVDALLPPHEPVDAAVAALIQHLSAGDAALSASVAVSPAFRDWSSAGRLTSRYHYAVEGDELTITVVPDGEQHYRVSAGAREWLIGVLARDANSARLSVDGHQADVLFATPTVSRLYLSLDGRASTFDNRLARAAGADETAGGGRVVAGMHGLLVELAVAAGDRVEAGTRLLVLEAMKMQHEISAGTDGVVSAVHAAAGQQVAAGQLLLEIRAESETAA